MFTKFRLARVNRLVFLVKIVLIFLYFQVRSARDSRSHYVMLSSRVCVVGGGGGLLEVLWRWIVVSGAREIHNNQKNCTAQNRPTVMLFSRVFHETFLFSLCYTSHTSLLLFALAWTSLLLPDSSDTSYKNLYCKIYFFYMFASRSHARSLSLWIFFILYFVYIFSPLFSLSLRHTMDLFFLCWFLYKK